MRRPSGCLLLVLGLLCVIGGCTGGGMLGGSLSPPAPNDVVYARLPHHLAPSKDSPSFRFAMVHDVIHERYARHGAAFYEERERLAREKLPAFHPDSETAFALTDDIAVGLARRGRADEASVLMREKLKRQEALELPDADRYSSLANLAEFLLQANLWKMFEGDPTALLRVREARDLIQRAMRANPEAHFGRERWQLVAIEAYLDYAADPGELARTDVIGNRLDCQIQAKSEAHHGFTYEATQREFARPYLRDWTQSVSYTPNRDPGAEPVVEESNRESTRKRTIAHVGGEDQSDTSTIHRGLRAPFDEPALWLIGEWRQGSGPSPHLALCLGEIMLRVGQRFLAWTCYERAHGLASSYWPTEQEQQRFRALCRERQQSIEKSLPPAAIAELRPRFEAELAFGQRYQQEFQAYTEARLAAGKNLNDADFFEEFHAGRSAIASRVGPEEWYAGERQGSVFQNDLANFWKWGLLGGGASLLVLACVLTYLTPRPGRPGVNEVSFPENE